MCGRSRGGSTDVADLQLVCGKVVDRSAPATVSVRSHAPTPASVGLGLFQQCVPRIRSLASRKPFRMLEWSHGCVQLGFKSRTANESRVERKTHTILLRSSANMDPLHVHEEKG